MHLRLGKMGIVFVLKVVDRSHAEHKTKSPEKQAVLEMSKVPNEGGMLMLAPTTHNRAHTQRIGNTIEHLSTSGGNDASSYA